MSDESLRSLRYCLTWLRWANDRLGGAIQNLRELLQRWNESDQQQPEPMSVAALIDTTSPSPSSEESQSRQAALAARLAALKADVLHTLKQVVEVVSNYAGGALPENARNLVHRHLTSLPQRFSIANARPATRNGSNNSTLPPNEKGDRRDSADDVPGSAQRVLVLAQEGLDMMTQVSGVVNDTLVSAESWCERLGRKTRSENEGESLLRPGNMQQLPPMSVPMQQRQREEQQQRLLAVMEERRRSNQELKDGRERSLTVGRERKSEQDIKADLDVDVDVKMEGT